MAASKETIELARIAFEAELTNHGLHPHRAKHYSDGEYEGSFIDGDVQSSWENFLNGWLSAETFLR